MTILKVMGFTMAFAIVGNIFGLDTFPDPDDDETKSQNCCTCQCPGCTERKQCESGESSGYV
jgi:hypothetical protein